MKAPERTAEVRTKVPFHDVDAMEVVWHGHYVKYFELARCALFDNIDYNFRQMKASGFAWPVVDLCVRYARSARFGQELRVTAELVEWEHRLKLAYEVFAVDTGERLARGSTIHVAVDLATGESCFASPKVLFEKLGLPLP